MKVDYTLIIPHYNIPKLLQRLLRTVPHRDDLQVVVVDDCSTKDLNLLESVQEDYDWVEWYTTGINGGAGKARNVGLDHAKGKFVLFADSDDFFNICFDDLLDKYRDSDLDVIYFSANSVDTETFNDVCELMPHYGIISNYLKTGVESDIKYRIYSPWGKLIKRELIEDNNIRFRESGVFNDMHFSQRCDYYARNIAADITAYYCYAIRANSVSSITTIEKEMEKLNLTIEYVDFLKNHNVAYSLTYPVGSCFFRTLKVGGIEKAFNTLNKWHKSGYTRLEVLGGLISWIIKRIKVRK